MFRKDYIMRQYEEFGKFLAIVLGYKADSKFIEMEELINTSAFKYTNIEVEIAEKLPNKDFIQLLTENYELKEANLKMLGDLLYEKGIGYSKQLKEKEAENAFQKTLLIFEFIKENSLESDFSLDMHFKMNSLKQMLNK
ncbi:MAG: hypothetical protein KA163_03845 [Bacteroidia bacterium]|nr:hypothetical protein [Bacteroidia bacterium]